MALIAVLENVRNITKRCDENEAASKRVDSLLSSYEDKLKALEDLLKQAGDTLRTPAVRTTSTQKASETFW